MLYPLSYRNMAGPGERSRIRTSNHRAFLPGRSNQLRRIRPPATHKPAAPVGHQHPPGDQPERVRHRDVRCFASHPGLEPGPAAS